MQVKNDKDKVTRLRSTNELFGERGVVNPFAPRDFAEKRILKLVVWFSGHCRAIKS